MPVRVEITLTLPEWWGADATWDADGAQGVKSLIEEDLVAFVDGADWKIEKLPSAQEDRLRTALAFYANEENYAQRGWQGDPDQSRVDADRGTVARSALEG